MVRIPWISVWIYFIGNSHGDIILSVTSSSKTPSACILDGELSASVLCEITPSTSSAVVWKRNAISLTTCDYTADLCIPTEEGRYSFSSNVTQNQFYLNIQSVALGSDEGVYLCKEGSVEESITLAVCKVPTAVTFTELGNETVTLTSMSDCVYPEADVTTEWFYVLVSFPNTETRLSLTPLNGSIISDCENGAKKVTSTIQHTDASDRKTEVYFRVKVSHPASAEPVVATFNNKSYFIENDDDTELSNNGVLNTKQSGNGVLVVVGIIVCLILHKDTTNSSKF